MKKKVVGVYLAAGSSKRMGTSKQSLDLGGGIRLAGVALMQALNAGLYCVVVVVRKADELDWLTEEAFLHIERGRCRIEVCEDSEFGMAHSLRKGIQVAEEMDADGVLVILADQPFIDSEMLAHLTDVFSKEDDYDYIASGDKGIPKPPVILGRRMWAAVASLEGDVGARSLFRLPMYHGRILAEENLLKFMDIDTMERYEKAKKIFRGSINKFE